MTDQANAVRTHIEQAFERSDPAHALDAQRTVAQWRDSLVISDTTLLGSLRELVEAYDDLASRNDAVCR